MADIQEYEIELDKIIYEIGNSIKNLRKYKNSLEVTGGIDLLKNRLKRAKWVLRSLKLDLKELSEFEIKKYQSKVNKYEEQIKTLENDLNWIEKVGNEESGDLKIDDSNIKNNNGILKNDNEYQDIMKKAKNFQENDKKITTSTLETIIKVNEIGTSTLGEMAIQEGQMKRIQNDMNEIDSNLKLATRQMRSFARKMATDKIILGFILLIIAGIIVLIVYSTIKSKFSS
ncbi:hypothetical protein RB653_000743 [Dictyostelium firmibasis]|uniref:t-SNARE coiled-coil homology domain-containing protein n=1 Tax=Dictyostelium firmibasis TaxID=79012 RepID=A0AAN7TVP0_9MYCE